MANPRNDQSLWADKSGDGLLGDRQSNIADAAVTTATLSASAVATLTAPAVATLTAPAVASLTAGTTALCTVTWSSNDPGGTPDGAITIANGSALVAAEMMEFLEEYEGNCITLKALADELIADHAIMVTLQDELVADHAIMVTLQDELVADHATMVTFQTEIVADHATIVTDLGVMATKINAILDVLEEHGLMAA